jgi:hypothetical protein
MSWLGAGGMSHVVVRMNSEHLIGILSTSLIPTIEELANKLFSGAKNHIFFQKKKMKPTKRALQNSTALRCQRKLINLSPKIC